MNSWDEFERTLIAYGVVAAFAVAALAALSWRRRGRILPLPRLRTGGWSGGSVIFQFVLNIVCVVIAMRVLGATQFFERALPGDASIERRMNLASPFAFILFLAMSFTALYSMNRTTIASVGLSLYRWRPNAILGILGFLVVTPLVFGVFALCLTIFEPSEHKVEQLAREPLAGFEWAILFLQTVVIAPVLEEWLFRGLLQGWLRRTNLLGHAMLLWITISLVTLTAVADKPREGEVGQAITMVSRYAPIGFATVIGGFYALGVLRLYRPVLTRGLGIFIGGDPVLAAPDLWTTNLFEAEGRENRLAPWSDFGASWFAWKDANARLAIIGSSMAFSLAHSNWPSPVPLFAFGLVLGWLAYRTQNLVPGIVLHALFNLVSFLVLWMTVHPGGIMGSDANVARNSPASTVVPGVCCPR